MKINSISTIIFNTMNHYPTLGWKYYQEKERNKMIERKTHEIITQKISMDQAADFLGLKPEKGYAQCPFCGCKGKTLMLFKGSAYCTECHAAGNHADITMQALKLSNEEDAIHALQEKFGFKVILSPAQKTKNLEENRKAQDVEKARARIARSDQGTVKQWGQPARSTVFEGDREMVKRWDEEQPKKKAEQAKAQKEYAAKCEKWLVETIEQTGGALKIYASLAHSREYAPEVASRAQAQLQLLEKAHDHLKSGGKPAQDLCAQYAGDDIVIRAIKLNNQYKAVQTAIETGNSTAVATHIVATML